MPTPIKTAENRHPNQRSEFSPFEWRAIGQSGSRCRAHFDGRFEDRAGRWQSASLVVVRQGRIEHVDHAF